MALEAALEELCNDLRKFRDVLQGLEITVLHDRPEDGGVLLVDDLGDKVTDLSSSIVQALSSAEEARESEKEMYGQSRMRRALGQSQKRFLDIQKMFFGELLSYEGINELVGFGRKGGREWTAWVNSVRQGLERCRPVLEASGEAYCQSWQEIAERATSGPVSVHSTNIGQQITTAALESNAGAESGIT